MKNIKVLWTISLIIACNAFPLLASAQNYDDLNEQADKEYAANNYQKAIDLATQSLSLQSNPRSYYVMANSKYSLKDFRAAQADYTTAISTYSSYYTTDKYKGSLYYWRGRCKQKLESYADAISDFDNSITYNYDDPGHSYWNRANCYYNLKKYKESDNDYEKAIDRISDSKDLVTLYKARGDCHGMLDDYTNADKYYSRAIDYDATDYYSYWTRAYYRNLDSKHEEAIADYAKAASIIEAAGAKGNNNDLAVIYKNIALINYDANKSNEALTAINKSLLADPNFVSAFETRADIYQQMKNYDKAKADYTNAISITSDNQALSDLYFDRSYKLDWKTLDYKNALDDLNKSIVLDPKDGMKFWHRAITYDHKKDYLKALADCNKAILLYADYPSAGLYMLRASIKENSGDIKGAVTDYQAALKVDDNSATAYYNLGRLFKTKLKNDDLAELNLTKAYDLSKADGVSSTYAYAVEIKGDSRQAVSLILQNVEKYKSDSYQYKWQLHNAACIYALSGDKTKALEFLDKSLAAGFDDYDHLVNDRDLVSLVLLPQYKIILAKYKVPQPKW